MTHKQTTAFHLFSFPQLHLGFFCFFTFTAWHKLWVLCLAFFRAWCASQIVTKAFLHAPHNKSFLYSFLSFVLHLTGTRKLQHCLVPTLMFLLFPFCQQRECMSTSNAFFLVFQLLFSRSPPLVFFLSALYILRFFWGGAILKCYMILLMRTLTRNSSA